MPTPPTYPTRTLPPTRPSREAGTGNPLTIRERWRSYRSERQRRFLVRWLRRTALRAHEPDPIARRHSVLLHYRAIAARSELLALAATLERVPDPDPDAVSELQNLLANNDGESPLYNPGLPAGELDGTLLRIRTALESEEFGSRA
jgi:hypothetical protein